MPKVSIITPVYIDIEAKVSWLGEMIESVLSQTFTDWELILVDDKSPIAYNLTHVDSRIRFLQNAQNSGPCLTRNTAAGLAESDCLLPLDSDDMLASNDTLERMYEVWQADKSKIIFGNVQQLLPTENGFRPGKTFDMGTYTFERVMNLGGLIPVTAMHSLKCHQASGGWKAELTAGLEDVEYWIAAGERGYCGYNIGVTTLLYRRQDQTRTYHIRHISKVFDKQQQLIKAMHAPIYRGEFPMACCGKSTSNAPSSPANLNLDPAVMSAANMNINKITTLQGYDEKDLEWIAYQGSKKGSFGVLVRGPSNLPASYQVYGAGHYFQIHKEHHDYFSQRQHLGFRLNQPDPRKREDERLDTPQAAPPSPKATELPRPPLSTLVRLDPVGQLTRQPEVIIEPNAANSTSYKVNTVNYFTLNDLGLSEYVTTVLAGDQWTVEKLSQANIDDLTVYDGIGIKRATDIISKAKELIS